MLKVILAKIGVSLFHYMPLEQIVAKLLTSVIRKLLASRHATKVIDRVRKTVIHRNELTALISSRLDDMVVPDGFKRGFTADFSCVFKRFQPVPGAIVSIVINNGACNRMNRLLGAVSKEVLHAV